METSEEQKSESANDNRKLVLKLLTIVCNTMVKRLFLIPFYVCVWVCVKSIYIYACTCVTIKIKTPNVEHATHNTITGGLNGKFISFMG